jgi:hypothetical protein
MAPQLAGQLTPTDVAVEKLHFPQNSRNLGDRNCPRKTRTSFVGHPDAILFSRISREGVFNSHEILRQLTLIHYRSGQMRARNLNDFVPRRLFSSRLEAANFTSSLMYGTCDRQNNVAPATWSERRKLANAAELADQFTR